jgi:hypothetical protein
VKTVTDFATKYKLDGLDFEYAYAVHFESVLGPEITFFKAGNIPAARE